MDDCGPLFLTLNEMGSYRRAFSKEEICSGLCFYVENIHTEAEQEWMETWKHIK